MDFNFGHSLAFVLESEGGYSNHPSDKGGETNMGISRRMYPEEDIKNMTVERAGEIYYRDYWQPIHGPLLPSRVDYVTFDCAVNSGVISAGKLLQRAMNRYGAGLEVDGIIGPVTMSFITYSNPILAYDILKERDILYRKIVAQNPDQEVFFKGWMNRLRKVKDNMETLPT